MGSNSALSRLAGIAQTLQERHAFYDNLDELFTSLLQANLPISGYAPMLGDLLQLLQQSEGLLKALGEQKGNKIASADLIRQLERKVSDPLWKVGEDSLANLREFADSVQKESSGYKDQVVEWRGHADRLRNRLEDARRVHLPVYTEQDEVLRLDDSVKGAERALTERRYTDLAQLLSQITKFDPGDILKRIDRKAEDLRQYDGRADLYLLRSSPSRRALGLGAGPNSGASPVPPSVSPHGNGSNTPGADPDGFYVREEYLVMLRTGGPENQGINIQGRTQFGSGDRDWVLKQMGALGEPINRELRRLFTYSDIPVAQPNAAVSPSAVTPQAIAPPVASPAADAPGPAVTTASDSTRHLSAASDPSFAAGGLDNLLRVNGNFLFRLIVPEAMQLYLESNQHTVTITTNDLELPWELMHYKGDFLCLHRPVARMPMGSVFPRPRRSGQAGAAMTGQSARSALRFLLIYADPANTLPRAKAEVEKIETALKTRSGKQIEVEVWKTPDQTTSERLTEMLPSGRYDVIHFAGHATFDRENPDMSGLLPGRGEPLFAQKIRRLLEGQPLVFLNACETSCTANESQPQCVTTYLQGPAEGLASAFMYGGAVGVIGALWPIFDGPAADFAIEFYTHVLEGHAIGEAMRRARRYIRDEKRYHDQITWAAYVLYGDPRVYLV